MTSNGPINSLFINDPNVNKIFDEKVEIRRRNNGTCETCKEPNNTHAWCTRCDPRILAERVWTSGNKDIDEFIRETQNNAKSYWIYLEWIDFQRFKNIRRIGEGGFAKVYSATWLDGRKIIKQNKKSRTSPINVALKCFKGSQEISTSFLNEIRIHYQLYLNGGFLRFYGISRDPQTNEFIMVSELVNNGNLRNLLTRNFNNIMWSKKISFLKCMILDINKLHELEYCHKNLHSGNVLLENSASFLTDFGLSGPANKSSNEIYGVLPYVAPEVLRGSPYTTAADIYSYGIIMVEMSSGKPPYHDRKHDDDLAIAICNGLRPEFGKGTPEIYKDLSNRCTNADPDQRPTANELYDIMWEWEECIRGRNHYENAINIRKAFEQADREIQSMTTSYTIHPEAVFTSKRLK